LRIKASAGLDQLDSLYMTAKSAVDYDEMMAYPLHYPAVHSRWTAPVFFKNPKLGFR